MFYKKGMGSTSYTTAYGNVNDVGTLITIDSFPENNFGPIGTVEITVSGENLTGTIGDLNYSAVKISDEY